MAAESVATPESTNPSPPTETRVRRRAPWRGRKRTEAGEAKGKFIAVRVTEGDRQRITDKAQESGLKIGGYLRALALGSAGARAVKRPRVEREQLARLLGEIGKLGSNVNQLAKWSNTARSAASVAELAQIRADIGAMREAVMKALDRGD
jgi:mobilization protein NikA